MSTQDEIKKVYEAIDNIRRYLNDNRWEWRREMSEAESAWAVLRDFMYDPDIKLNIFYEVLHSFHVDDAMNRVEEFLEESEDIEFEREIDFDYLADQFFERKNCNIADNDLWKEIII